MFSITRKLSPLTQLRRPLPLPFPLSSPTYSLTLPPPPPCPPPNSILSLLRRFSSQPPSSPSPISLAFIRGGCHDAVHPHFPPFSLPLPLCPGCGVHMQDSDSSLPGFFSRPSTKSPDYHAPIFPLPLSSTSDPETSLSLKSGHLQELSEGNRDHLPENSSSEDSKPLVCARCHSLRHYGRVREPSAENLLPDFDFDLMVAPKMASPSGPRSVVLFVVDAADFDGSFPRKVARLLSPSIDRNALAWKENKPANLPRIILVVTKLDLLPPSLSPEMLDNWVRRRANTLGAAKLAGLHLVSAVRDWGVRNLVEQVAEFAGPRGNVWAVGAQNAGKSTLINAMARCVGRKMTQLTEAPVPGTTLGIVRVEGVLSGQAKLFDTPGILHPYQITTRLTREEQKLVHICKELKPRTYRIMVGHSVHIGGLMRLDVEESSADSIYLTVWASPLLPLHMGKQQNSHIMMEDHFGRQLQPPIGANRVTELGKLARTEFRVSGDSWDESKTDIAAAGLGWVAVCLKGEALLSVWTYDGIDVVSRSSLITKKAKIFEEAGFTASKIVSKADSIFSKERQNRPAKKKNLQNMKLG
ncbi:GTP-binding protein BRASSINAZOLE INSENSITIVE PALE GREEN 2, chloroplastic [Phalaenopsis equestris]|uniref:GTP-binding protein BRASSINAZOLE INSENSITIVE PALE GREEN 2, chloroplastic n=1 Tax=Phalaenopsis equestris TaxID=78828 RepID=UPI0009E20F1B|nr:GTP-binding protein BRASSINAZOLE INSENSITIVE PALE GREEN 2, chloroplastic [Phalaenopsis equestris]